MLGGGRAGRGHRKKEVNRPTRRKRRQIRGAVCKGTMLGSQLETLTLRKNSPEEMEGPAPGQRSSKSQGPVEEKQQEAKGRRN